MVAITMPLLMLIVNISMAAIMWFGAHRIDSGGAMPIGNLTAFIAYTMQILIAVMMATVMFIMIRGPVPRQNESSKFSRLSRLSPPQAPAALNPGTADSDASVEFRDVEFTYPGAETPVLRGISFIAYPGETTAIVGSTGCGKSTLINLIPPRFYDVTGGSCS